jgi:hypothetical protein
VNEVVGGPYRSHNQRHHFTENILDVYLYDALRHEELAKENLHRKLPRGTADWTVKRMALFPGKSFGRRCASSPAAVLMVVNGFGAPPLAGTCQCRAIGREDP